MGLEVPMQGATTARRFHAPVLGMEIKRASLRLGTCEAPEFVSAVALTIELVGRGRGGSAQPACSARKVDVRENCRNMLITNHVLW
jgi:hypothetical protein